RRRVCVVGPACGRLPAPLPSLRSPSMTTTRRVALASVAFLLAGTLTTKQAAAASSQPKGTRADRVLVRAKLSGSLSTVALLHQSKVLRGVHGTRWSTIAVPAGRTASAFVDELKSDLGVADAQLDLGQRPPEG